MRSHLISNVRSGDLINSISGMWCSCAVHFITSHVTTKMPRCQAKMRKSILTLPPSHRLPLSLYHYCQLGHITLISSPLLARYQNQLAYTSFQFHILFPFQGNLLPVSLQFLPIFLFFSLLLFCFSLSL